MTVTDTLPSASGVRALVASPGYGIVAAGALLWHTNRWGSLFATTLLLTDQDASALHIQLIGALFFAPMLVGAFATRIFEAVATPRSIVLSMQLLLIPTQAAMLVMVSLGLAHVWVTALFMLVVGMGNTVNMTSQRLLIHDAVDDAQAPTAMAVEPLLSGIGSMIGAFGTGVLVDSFGHASSFGVLTFLAAGCVAFTLRIPRRPYAGSGRGGRRVVRADSRLGAMIRANPTLATMIAVTVVMNLCVFGYQPLIPKIAERFSSSAAVAGALIAAVGVGQLLGGVIIVSRVTRRRHHLLLAGSATATLGVVAFPLSGSVAVAFVALFVVGIGQAGFSAMQSVMSVEPRDPAVRAAALGAVATAVGAMPIGMLVIGGLSQWLGPRGGVLLAALTGLSLLVLIAVVWRSTWLPQRSRARRE